MDTHRHPVDSLFLRLRETFPDFPPTMVQVPFELRGERVENVIEGTSFFPGGRGLVRDAGTSLPHWPEGKIMVIGNDWGDERSFDVLKDKGAESPGSTWRGIFELFPQVLDFRDCFFANAFMGLRVERQSSVGECPARRDFIFKGRCREFLNHQIGALKPRLILTLGKWVPDMLAPLAPTLRKWSNDGKPVWKEIDRLGPLQEGVVFDAFPKHSVVVCALTHPDRAWLNYARRTYGRFVDEIGLLQAAVSAAGLTNYGVTRR